MLYKCIRFGGTALWSVADAELCGLKREIGTNVVGEIGEGNVCLVLNISDGPIERASPSAFTIKYLKIFFDGKTGYVRADSLQALEQ
jgi:hypothetical protein